MMNTFRTRFLLTVLWGGVSLCAQYVDIPESTEKALHQADTAEAWQQLMPEAKAYTYKQIDQKDLPLYVFPAQSASNPPAALVLFSGGAFRYGGPVLYRQALDYSARGITVILPKYRGTRTDQVQVIDCYRDARDAMIWIHEHAEELGVDESRIAVGGSSAGSIIALALATLDFLHKEAGTRLAVPDALLLYDIGGGAAMTAPIEGDPILGPDPDYLWNWYTEERFGQEPESLSPFHHLHEDLPPACLFLGGAESPRNQYGAWLLYSTVTQKGALWDLHFLADMPHAAMVNTGAWAPQVYRSVVDTSTRFLIRHGFVAEQ
jgi:acetyl esterase/lipase